MTFIRGKQSDRLLKLSHDRKVSPQGWYQPSRARWVPQIPNSFGLPAGISCPGATEFCQSCYAKRSEQSSGVAELVAHNYRLLCEAGTVAAMADLLSEMVERYRLEADRRELAQSLRIFRIHWDGDFFSVDYARAWAQVIRAESSIAFWTYTRSFVEPVDVVGVLAGIDNLALYLSADAWNLAAARQRVIGLPDVRLAICSVDYLHGRGMGAGRSPVVCPENAGRVELMTDGVGACVSCRLCPDGRRDVIFATSHREDVEVKVTLVPKRKHVPPAPIDYDEIMGYCLNSECGLPLKRKRGTGRQPMYCTKQCRWRARYLRTHARARTSA